MFDRVYAATPAGWKVATDRRAKCEIAVPASWMPGALNVGMKAPQGDVSVIVSSSPLPTLAEATQQLRSPYIESQVEAES